jgi:hypothetical protein
LSLLADSQREHAMPLVELLHPSARADALVEITAMRGRQIDKQYFTRTDVAVAVGTEATLNGFNVFINVNPRCRCSAFERDVPYVTALFLDLQYERTSPAEVDGALAIGGIPPTVAAMSGGGEHRYLTLSEPAEPARAKLVWQRLCKYTKSDPVHSLNRIARLPGTLNWKNVQSPRWCCLTGIDRERSYTLEQIDSALDALGAPPARKPIEAINVPACPPDDWFGIRNRLREQLGGMGILDLIDTGERSPYSTRQPTRSEGDWAVVCALVRAGASNEMIAWVFASTPLGAGKYAEAGVRYLNRTIEAARREVANPQGQPPSGAYNPRRGAIGALPPANAPVGRLPRFPR